MRHPLRLLLAAVTTALTITTASLQAAAPAQAAPGDSCAEPRVVGTVAWQSGQPPTYRITSRAEAAGTCPSTFTEYRYEALYFTNAGNYDEVESGGFMGVYNPWTGERVGSVTWFPTAVLAVPGTVHLTVQVFTRSRFFGGDWVQQPNRYYRLHGTGSFDTSNSATAFEYMPASCPTPGVGGKVPCG